MTRSTLPSLDLKYLYFPDATVPQLFTEAALSFPDKTAIRAEGSEISYLMLLRNAQRVASLLTAAGAAPGALVGLAMLRSPAAVTAILGALLAGCAYVPLDVEGSPESLLQRQIAESNLSFVLVDSSAACKAAAWSGCTSVPVPPPLLDLPEPSAAPSIAASPEDPAYVMFTSGSTGTPKGVIVPHRAIVRLVSAQHYLNFSPNETFLLHSPLSFDASTLELWGALLHGACLAIAPPHTIALSEYQDLVERYAVTTLWMTSAIFHLAATYAPETFRTLRQLIIGGDVIHPSSVRKIQDLYPALTIVNGYGPTENCTFTTCYRIPPGISVDAALPIGRPIDHTSVYVLDSSLQPVADGESGELVTGGSGVALGYLNLPRETEERFVPDPFSAVPDARMYRTGDRVYKDASGIFHFLGRLDKEVKISGRRIDLTELERLLIGIEGVRACAALALESGSGQKELAIAVEMSNPDASAEQRIRKELAARMPTALLPTRIHVAEQLPINQNGKLDRSTIRQTLESSAPVSPRANPSPASSAGSTLDTVLEIWKRLLGRNSVNADDNFFDTGGTSLLLIRLHAELNDQYPHRVSMIDLFQATTARKLSALIDARALSGIIPPPTPSAHRPSRP